MHQQGGTEQSKQTPVWLTLIRTHGRNVLALGLAAAVLVALIGAAYIRWKQTSLVVASLEFRPTFAGLQDLKYPNQLPFSPSDVTASSIVDSVYDANNVSATCDREAFRAGFYVEQRSDQSVFLDLEYQSRLSEPRITVVERKLLQDEHAAKRKALPLQYRLVFVTPLACSGLSQVVVKKVMVDVLNQWANESETKRGVLNHQKEILTPGTLDIKPLTPGGLLLRADQLRSALARVATNIDQMRKLPGAELIRLGPGKLTFLEVQDKMSDLINSRLDPLVMTSGRLMLKESAMWVTETVAAAERRQKAAARRAEAYREALQQFSNAQVPTGTRAASSIAGGGGPANSPAMTAQLDRTFIDRLLDMSAGSAAYRQELTDGMVESELAAVEEQLRADYYKRLLDTARAPAPADMDEDTMARNLNSIVEEGKELTKQFNALYEEFSRVALRSSGAMFVTEKPVWVESTQQFSNRSVLKFSGVVFVATVLLTFGFILLRDRWKLLAH